MSEHNFLNVPIVPTNNTTNGNWYPVIGEETTGILEAVVPMQSREGIRDAAISILAKGISPTTPVGQETGLVIGYVQSGKTMSFETVIALARDNGIKIVIVLAGTSNPLLNQSYGRLRRDLRLDEANRARKWVLLKNPSEDETIIHSIRDVLDEWRDAETPDEYKKTVLITVLKQHQRLQNLTQLVQTIGMQGVSVLIIDDEADQASLNNEVNQLQESTTYQCLMALRRALPNHTYLQYTATPQAPLLINIIDSLSPNFVQVLNPGQNYVGGRDLFTGDFRYLHIIPENEVPTRDHVLVEPPDTLLAALRVFMIGVTAGICESHNTGNRSMMVHPSRGRSLHQEYINWVRSIFDEWKRILGLPDHDTDRQQLLEDFRGAHEELSVTVSSALPSFTDLVPSLLRAFRNTRILEVNARRGSTPEIDWRDSYGWILVGGQAMDRGFTVEGLTVTYLPRGIGVGNADTIQQRARFFGYKRHYLGYCRIYLEQGTLDALQNYVEHEENIRNQLIRYQDGRRSLKEWKRAFILDTELRPCRNNVLNLDYIQKAYSDSWVGPRIVLASDEILEANRSVVESFVNSLSLENDGGHPERTAVQRHLVCGGVPLRTVIEQLLLGIRITNSLDSQRFTGLLVQLSCVLDDNPDELCTVYRMSPLFRRQRSVNEYGELANLFQGASPVEPIERRGEIYPGDRFIRDTNNLTIQIHSIDIENEGIVIKEKVAVIAVWVPARMAKGWICQEEQHNEP